MADKSFFGCPYCQAAFPDKHELEVHEKMTHPDKPFAVEMKALPERERELLMKAPTAAISKAMPMSEVSRHCIPEDCWVAIEGKAYDLTEFMDRHPGGPTTILNSAGKDATKMFKEIHKGVRIEQYLLPDAFLGDVGIDEDLMSDSFWHKLRQARIEEIEDELKRIGGTADAGGHSKAASSIQDLLDSEGVTEELKNRLRSLETQKRAALDAEDFTKATSIKAKQAELLAAARVELGGQDSKTTAGGIPLSEVARHNKPHDLWVAVNGVVYDLTDFLLHHPEQRNVLLAWAGRDATAVWDKIPGRFPSKTWMSFYMRPELRMGDVGPEPPEAPQVKLVRELRRELRRLRGPSQEDIEAAKAGSKKPKASAAEVSSKADEEERFPKLKDVKISKELPFFTRAEVAKHKGPPGGAPGTEPYMILHNKVYDLTLLLGAHPGGDDLLLSNAGLDATKDFELFEHSEKARVRREQEMLVGYIVPAESSDWTAEAAAAGVAGGVGVSGEGPSDMMLYLRYKAADVAVGLVAMYAYRSYKHRKPLPMLMYSRLLRHMHLIMAVGIFGTLASANAASYAEGLTKKRLLQVHKQTGFAMFLALFVRIFARAQSGIPPRFPGHPMVQWVESQSLRLFYLLIFVLPVSGMAQEYFLKWAGGDDAANDRLAQQSIEVHKKVGKFFEAVWMPFHLGYTTLWHFSQGRGVVRKVSPFI